MLELHEPSPSRLIVASMWNIAWSEDDVFNLMRKSFGEILSSSEIFPFSFSDYYNSEMGSSIKKCFVEISGLHVRNALLDIKTQALKTERKYAKNGMRSINLDPMMLSLENLIIATTKNYSHRVYLGKGIFADLALVYRKKHFEVLPWTYPDYVKQISYFEKVRETLL